MTRKIFALACAAAVGFAAPANAVTVVNVSGANASTNGTNAVTKFLSQGLYKLTFTQGAFTSHNRFGGGNSGCASDGTGCATGWETNVRFYLGSDAANFGKLGNFQYYKTQAQAFAASSVFSTEFSVGAGGQNVNFYIYDTFIPDNRGGVSIGIAAVPEPATWAMLIMGFGLIGGAYRSRRTTGKISFA